MNNQLTIAFDRADEKTPQIVHRMMIYWSDRKQVEFTEYFDDNTTNNYTVDGQPVWSMASGKLECIRVKE